MLLLNDLHMKFYLKSSEIKFYRNLKVRPFQSLLISKLKLGKWEVSECAVAFYLDDLEASQVTHVAAE